MADLRSLARSCALLVACAAGLAAQAQTAASAAVAQANAAVARTYDLADGSAFADAQRGFVAAPTGQVRDGRGNVVWDFDSWAFQQGPAPATVNPSLWRQAQLSNRIGLFKVADAVWQLRGFDLSHMTLIEGRSGWIVVDTLASRETAAAAISFARRHLGHRPVSAIVYTHSHLDAFGGTLGVMSADEARARAIPIVAPAGFLEEATSENVLMGLAMGRRSTWMYGALLPRSATGTVDTGIGKAVAYGQIGILPPTVVVDRPKQDLVIDGVRFVFYNAPGAEAPAEMAFHLPELKAYCGADLMLHTIHNLYTLRGAKVRDALRWARYLDEAVEPASRSEVVFNQHHWPVWGSDAIHGFVTKQRDVYRYIHDQTVRLMNAGLSAAEIAETLKLPPVLDRYLGVRGYYGTVKHNARAVYQYYLGWFDAHPANLDGLPPVEAGRRYVALAGGADKLRVAAREAYDGGDYRWAAELLKHAVYADPGDRAARELMAQAFEQMGYLAESAPWRNFYLSGALELRQGPPKDPLPRDSVLDMLQYTPVERFLEAMAASLNGPKAADSRLRINLVFSDLGENWVLAIENGVLHAQPRPPAADANATLTLTKNFFLRMMVGSVGALELLLSPETKIEGSRVDLGRFFALLDKAPGNFPIVTR